MANADNGILTFLVHQNRQHLYDDFSRSTYNILSIMAVAALPPLVVKKVSHRFYEV